MKGKDVSKPELLTWIAQLERILQVRETSQDLVGFRPTTLGDKSDLADLYFTAYPRDIVSTLAEAREEMDVIFDGEYGEPDLASSPLKSSSKGIVGAVLTVHEAPWPDTPPGPFIVQVMVHPDHRRQGLAQQGMLAAAAELWARNERTVALRVMSNNEGALALYRRLGFTIWTGPERA